MKKMILAILCLLAVSAQAGLYYGIPVSVEKDNLGGVAISNGETPFPDGAIFPIAIELRAESAAHLKVVGGVVQLKTDAERAFADLPAKYKKQVNEVWVEMSQEEKNAVDAAEEAARQAKKALVLKTAENAYLTMCDQLSGQTAHTKLGFGELKTIIGTLPAEQQVLVTLNLLALDAELKREGGLMWWDDCAWHPDACLLCYHLSGHECGGSKARRSINEDEAERE